VKQILLPLSVFFNGMILVAAIVTWSFFRERTLYAENFSERYFEEMSCATTGDEALAQLGAPLAVNAIGKAGAKLVHTAVLDASFESVVQRLELQLGNNSFDFVDLQYSRPEDTRANYRVRTLRFNKNGQLYQKFGGYYLD
jgi:hypothetical protein